MLISLYTSIVDIVKLNVDEIEKTFRSYWDEADKIMEKYKKICEEYGVSQSCWFTNTIQLRKPM